MIDSDDESADLAPEEELDDEETVAGNDDEITVVIYCTTTKMLADVLHVTALAVAKAEREGRVEREADGRWEAMRVLDLWRQATHPWLRRDHGVHRPWFDVCRPLDEAMVEVLVARARLAGATVEARSPET